MLIRRDDILRLANAEQGVPLWGCTPGSPSDQAGLRYGDIILSVNGSRTRTAAEYARVADITDHPYLVEIRRGADLLTLTVIPAAAHESTQRS